jgi:hypothetical protein
MAEEVSIWYDTHLGKTRTEAWNFCADQCTTVSLSTIKNNVKSYWLIAGIGAYAAGNHIYDAWVAVGW